MTKEKRKVAGFGKVAGGNDSNINSDTEENITIDVESRRNDDILGNILEANKSKDETHTFKGFYLENDVARTIDRVTQNKAKGAKSDLVNEILKRYFKDADVM